MLIVPTKSAFARRDDHLYDDAVPDDDRGPVDRGPDDTDDARGLSSHAPAAHARVPRQVQRLVDKDTTLVFGPASMPAKGAPRRRKYRTCCLTHRGVEATKEANAAACARPAVTKAAATATGQGRWSQADESRSRAKGSVPSPPMGSSLERAHSLRGNTAGCL